MSIGQDVEFSADDFSIISRLAKRQYGIQLPRNKKDLLHARISKRMRVLGASDFAEYMRYITGADGQAEKRNFLSVLTTNTTSFFREAHHFELFANQIMPEFYDTNAGTRALRLWSAGCSYGQEPYSISSEINAFRERHREFKASITATDVDENALDGARRGIYRRSDITGLDTKRVNALFECGSGESYSISNENKANVKFENINLVGRFQFNEPFDVIFCCNVVIYFSRETQQKIWKRFLQCLRPGGYLFLGHSERLTGPISEKFESVGLTAYRRLKDN